MASLADKLSDILNSAVNFGPELLLVAGMLLLIVVDLMVKSSRWLSVLSILLATMVLIADAMQWKLLENPIALFSEFLMLDSPAAAWKVVLDVGVLLIMIMSGRSMPLKNRGESYPLIFTLLLGGHLLAMASNLLIVYLSIELISIPSYVLAAFHFNKRGVESAVKYLLFGAVASALMLYGMSWIYAFTGNLNFIRPEFIDALLNADTVPLTIASVLMLSGLLFKIAAVPFHIWAPDAYTSSPTAVVALFSTVPKLAGFSILAKWFLVINLFGLGSINWVSILSVIAMVTLLIGNFSALRQSNVKRMLAYSSIAHTGFMMVAIVSVSEQASRNLFFYAMVYTLMNIAVFTLVQLLEHKENITKAEEYKGMIRKYPFTGVLIVVLMVSLAGLPPTGGFTAKLLVFTSLWEAYDYAQNPVLLSLFLFGLLNTVISLFFYLKVPFFMIFRERSDNQKDEEQKNIMWENYFVMVLVLVILFLFFKPDSLMDVINNISFAF